MPTYDYRCAKCGHELEIFHSMKDAPKRKCPKCGKNALEKMIGNIVLAFGVTMLVMFSLVFLGSWLARKRRQRKAAAAPVAPAAIAQPGADAS